MEEYDFDREIRPQKTLELTHHIKKLATPSTSAAAKPFIVHTDKLRKLLITEKTVTRKKT